MGPNDEEQRISTMLVEMGAVLHNEETIDRVLQLVTELTERTVRSACAVSVTLARGDLATTPNASEPVARALDQVQYDTEDGPCLEALSERSTINATLGDADGRWPKFTRAAEDQGIHSILSVPLVVGDRSVGALNIYSSDPRTFDDAEETTASLLAQQAAAVLTNAFAFADANARNGQLLDALATRDLIGQAKGILMAREGCDADTAFDILRRASQRSNRKLRDIATDLVESAKGGAPS